MTRPAKRAGKALSPTQRLKCIAETIEDVDRRCEAADGPVSNTRQEMTDEEMSLIYSLAAKEGWKRTPAPVKGRRGK